MKTELSQSQRRLLYALSFLLILNGLFFYGFVRDGLWALIAVGLVFLARRIGPVNLTTLAVAFTAVTGLLLAGAALWDFDEQIYQDPGSRLSTLDTDGLPNYKKERQVAMLQPFGDLKRIAPPDLEFDLESREVRFKTDALGFRNERGYHGQPFVLVGDSFVLGSGNTQEENLTGQLLRDYGVDTYNLAFPTDLKGYVQNIEKLANHHGADFKAILFLYEGNDFTDKANWLERNGYHRLKWNARQWMRAYKRWFWTTNLYRYTWFAYRYLKTDLSNSHMVDVIPLGERRVAISQGYTGVARRTDYTAPVYFAKALAEVKAWIDRLVFIPAKYRVLSGLVNPAESLPNRQWEAVQSLGKALDLPVTDLTGALVEENKRLFEKNGALVFWTDDTHWNPKGIAVAARALCGAVPKLKCRGASATAAGKVSAISEN